MTPEELLIPRYKMIADFPGSHVQKVGDIITYTAKTPAWTESVFHSYWGRWPHLFAPLRWYEERTIEQMPTYVKWDNINEPEYSLVLKPNYYPHAPYLWEAEEDARLYPYQYSAMDFLPATQEEYQDYKSSLNSK